jgi:FdrA protein
VRSDGARGREPAVALGAGGGLPGEEVIEGTDHGLSKDAGRRRCIPDSSTSLPSVSGMTERVIVRRGAYYDSVTLMLVSRAAAGDGDEVAVGMATPLNLELLAGQGFTLDDDLGPNDLVIAVRTPDGAAADAAVAAVDRELAAKGAAPATAAERPAARSLAAAARRDAELSVAFLSIPGDHVAHEAAAALEAGLHVFCFSDGVDLQVEVALKRRALERNLLFMGADCGTAIIDGVALGFANAVERGPVGIVGASGTGIQQLCCLLEAAGLGVSHAVGVGGRDLHRDVGGVMMRRGLELLAADEDTRVIVAISKPPDPEVAAAIEDAAAVVDKSVVLGFDLTLEEAAARAAELAGGTPAPFDEQLRRPPSAGDVRGLYSGGTLCAEAARIVGRGTFTDFGADEFTEGRAHPMIDQSLRLEHLAATEEPVVLLDVVLGYGAHPDPAGELAPVIETLDRHVIVALCGTAGDPQGFEDQRRRLADAGAVVTRSNAHAARLARKASGG